MGPHPVCDAGDQPEVSPDVPRGTPTLHPRRSPTRATVPRSAGRGSSVRVLPTAGHKRHRAHLPQAPARTRSLLATTGTPCCLPCRWPAGAAAGPTGRSARGTAAPAPRRASASECPRSRRRSGHCLRREDAADTLLRWPCLRRTLGGRPQAPWTWLLRCLRAGRSPRPGLAPTRAGSAVFTALKTREPPSRTKRAVAVVAPGPCCSPDGKQRAEAPRHRASGSFCGHSVPAGGRDVPEARHPGFAHPVFMPGHRRKRGGARPASAATDRFSSPGSSCPG